MAASIAQRIISFGTTVVLARILSPSDFGLFALAFVMIDGFGIFKSLGFDSALVRRKDEDIEKACNTAFFLIPAMGMILFVILFFFAPIGAKFLNNPQVAPLIRTLAIVFVISTFGKVPQTILYRSMKFKFKSIAEVSATIVYSSIALILALNKFGVWSLVIAYILKILVHVGMEWYFSGWRPKLEFDKSIAWDMFHFGKYILASGILWFLYSNIDNIVIAKMLNVTMLGYYAISKNLSNFLTDYLLGRVGMIMYPTYSKIQEDIEDLKRVMFKTLKYLSILVFPFCFGLMIFAPQILRFIFGEKWLPATDILRILSLVGILTALETVLSPLFLAKGKSKADFQVNLALAGIFFVLVIPFAIKFKLAGVGFALLISSIISFIICVIRIKKILHFEVSKIFLPLAPALLCSLIMLTAAIFLNSVPIVKNLNFNFLISATISALIYFISSYFINRNILKDIREVVF